MAFEFDPSARTYNRRTFMNTLGRGLGAATLAVPGLSGLAAAASQEQTVGYALVGLGYYATNVLAPALQNSRVAKLTGIVTGTPSKAETWKAQYNIPEQNVYNYETFDQIADNPDIDVVYVVLPNSMHAEYTIRAAEAGKHVLCEKPMAVSVEECEAMIEATQKAGKKLAVGYRLHFEPHNQEAMRLGQEQVLGAPKVIEASFGFRIGDPTQWRLDHERAGGGALMDVGIYTIQGARYVTGEEPVAVTAQEVKTDPEKFAEVDETMAFQLFFPSGVIANCLTSYNARTERLYLSAEQGRFELSPAYGYSGQAGWVQDDQGRRELSFPETDYIAASMDDFADCVLNDRTSRVSGEEGLRDMRIIEAIYRAVETGGRVEIG